jgi:hypothetical protein
MRNGGQAALPEPDQPHTSQAAQAEQYYQALKRQEEAGS